MVKATRRFMFLAEALEQRISEVGGNRSLAEERIIADMDAHRLEVTWEDRDGATYTNILPTGCPSWWHAHFEWSQSIAIWLCPRPGAPSDFEDKLALCIKVRPAQKLPTTVVAETRCRQWLIPMMTASLKAPRKTKSEYCTAAKSLFGVSGRAFNRAWKDAIKTTRAEWDQPGRPKKS